MHRFRLRFLKLIFFFLLATTFAIAWLNKTTLKVPLRKFFSKRVDMPGTNRNPFHFWEIQRKGTNFFNEQELHERMKAAQEQGIHWIRLTPSKWKSYRPNTKTGDFLIGSKEKYSGLIKEDLETLKSILDMAHKEGLKVVLTFLSLPNHRWRQHNDDIQERKLFESLNDQEDALTFLGEVTQHLKGHPALVGINPINEPSPELTGMVFDDWTNENYSKWFSSIKSGPQDLNLFYRKVVKKIRQFDAEIPIILDVGFYATPWAFKILEPIKEKNIFYSFHMYEPYDYTFQKGDYGYPGLIPLGEQKKQKHYWDKSALNTFLLPVLEWQKQYGIPSSQIIVGEFGVYRNALGAAQYLEDLIAIFNKNGWHWAYYSFREDAWDKMDYELGTAKPPYHYWDAVENKKMPNYSLIKDKTLLEKIKAGLKK